MIKKILKLATTLMIGLAPLSNLRATDLIQYPDMRRIFPQIVRYENGPGMHLKSLITYFGISLECDMPILEAIYHTPIQPIKPLKNDIIAFLRHVYDLTSYGGLIIAKLDDDKNQSIYVLARNIFNYNRNINKSLTLCYRELKVLPNILGSLTDLTELTLDNNLLTEIPDSIGNLTNLVVLDLNYNKLKKLPDSMGQLTDLRSLYLNGNQLTELPATLGQLKNLHTIKMKENLGFKTQEDQLKVLALFSRRTSIAFEVFEARAGQKAD